MIESLPLLKPLKNISKIEKYYPELLSDDLDDEIDRMYSRYHHALLDNFETTLNIKDTRLSLLGNEYFMKINEYKYINFISEIFKNNNSYCVIDTNLFNLNYSDFLGYLNFGIDIALQYILLHQYISLKNIKSKYFIIKDIKLLEMFIVFGLRENSLNNFFFFPDDKSCIIVNYDQTFPIFSIDRKILDDYSNIAKNSSLYVR